MVRETKKRSFLDVLFRFHKLIIAFVLITSFFSFYNVFLIDHTLENLKFSLEQTALAYDIEDVKGLDMILTKTVANEPPPYGISSENNLNLEYAKSVVNTGKNFHQLDYMKLALSTVIQSKEKTRGGVLGFIDKINRPIRIGLIYLTYLPYYIFRQPTPEHPSEVDINLFEKIRLLEKEKDLQKLVAEYKDFIAKYPNYDRASLVKLQLAYTYQRLGQYDKAEEAYKDILKQYFPRKEAMIAQIFLFDLREKSKLLSKADLLLVKSRELSSTEIAARQELFYELGIIYTQLLNFDDAIKFFNKAISVDPASDLATKAQFNIAWLYKQRNDYEKSLDEFKKIIKEKPTYYLARDSRYQLADLYRSQGRYEEAVDLFLKLAEEYKDNPDVASLCLFQAGASCLYDLNDTERGEEIFKRLAKDYHNTSYGKYLSPESPTGIFITYLVPRAARVVAWRTMGLICLSGYSGEIVKFKAVTQEAPFNLAFNNWLKSELPDTIGNLYVDIRGHKTLFEGDKFMSHGRITMGGFNVDGRAEWMLLITKGKMLDLVVNKAFLDKVPILPSLINRALTGVRLIIEKNLPVEVNNVSMEKGKVIIDGYGSRTILERIKNDTEKLFLTEFEIETIQDPAEQKNAYDLFKKKFPEADFMPVIKQDDETIFLDFFTRISLYLTFKIIETVKDSKLDYERSVRTLGQLMLKKENFRVDFERSYLNTEIARYIHYEFPWMIDQKFLVDIKGVELTFTNNDEIDFNAHLVLGYANISAQPNDIEVKGTMNFEIDKESGIPKWVFKKVTLNDKPFPVERLNAVSLRCFNVLKDDRTPLFMEEIKTHKGGIIFKGKGAADFIGRVLYDPHPFVIFQIRSWDLPMAGVQRIRYTVRPDIMRVDTTGAYRGLDWRGVEADVKGAYYREDKQGVPGWSPGAVQQFQPEKQYRD